MTQSARSPLTEEERAIYEWQMWVDDFGETLHYLGMFSDITQSKEQQHALEMMAHYDVLTQLPNRTLFADRFKQAIAHSNRNNSLLAVVLNRSMIPMVMKQVTSY